MAESKTNSVLARSLAAIVRLYQIQPVTRWAAALLPGPATPGRCRFYPSCSEYTRESLLVYGAWRGLGRGIVRILKCHPWHPGGVDLVITHAK